MIKKLIYYFNAYEKIKDSYCGERTDWYEKCTELEILAQNVSDLEVRDCKNHKFYRWVKAALAREIREEFNRVWRLTH